MINNIKNTHQIYLMALILPLITILKILWLKKPREKAPVYNVRYAGLCRRIKIIWNNI